MKVTNPNIEVVLVFISRSGEPGNEANFWPQTNALPCSQAPAQLFAILGTRRLAKPNTCLESVYTRSPPYIQVLDLIKMADNTKVKWAIPFNKHTPPSEDR